MVISDKIEELRRQLEELNARVFGMEGQMKALDLLLAQDKEHREERHKGVMDAVEELKKELKKVVLKLAWYAGALATLIFVLTKIK